MKGKLKLNSKGVQQMLKDLQPDLAGRAAAIASAAGPGHSSEAIAGRKRAIGMVWTTSWEAMRAERKSGNLSRAIDAGRD